MHVQERVWVSIISAVEAACHDVGDHQQNELLFAIARNGKGKHLSVPRIEAEDHRLSGYTPPKLPRYPPTENGFIHPNFS